IGIVATAASVLSPRFEFGADALKLCLQISIAITAATLFLSALFINRIVDARLQIADSEQRFRRAMEDSAIGVAIVGLDGRIQQANPAFAAMLGYSRAEIEALTFPQITHPDDLSV
ncbi:PAS domain S-box protein, partial [Mesorhizobium sp. M2D.F.Ca.ET.160.01.1.1]